MTWVRAPEGEECGPPGGPPGEGGIYNFTGTAFEWVNEIIVSINATPDQPFTTVRGPGAYDFNFTFCYPYATLAGAAITYRVEDITDQTSGILTDTLRNATGQ